jgi:hypothetical protein
MCYYIIPIFKNCLHVNPKTGDICKSYISNSLFQYYKELCQEIKNNLPLDFEYTLEELIKIVNNYDYLYTKVPIYNYQVSKIKTNSNLFFDFYEILTTFNIFEDYKNTNIKTLHLSENTDSITCFKIFRKNEDDEILHYNNFHTFSVSKNKDAKIKFLFFNFQDNYIDFFEDIDKNYNNYITYLIQCTMMILKNQCSEGCCIIKIKSMFHKSVIDILFFLTTLYEKTYIFKPNTSNIVTFENYIILKNFRYNENNVRYLNFNYYKLFVFLQKKENGCVERILNTTIPSYFIQKIEDINISIGQNQIESLDLINILLKNKNYKEKIENIKKINIQKCISWCEKYNISFNNFEKKNIFLPLTSKNNEFL